MSYKIVQTNKINMQDNFITERQSRPLWNSLAFVFKLKIDSLWQSIFCCGFIKWYDLCRFGIIMSTHFQ